VQTREERLQKIHSYFVDWVKPVYQYRTMDTMSIYHTNREKIVHSLLASLDAATEAAKPMSGLYRNQKIAFIQFSYLLSATLTKELQLRIDLYDTRHYGDLTDTKSYWDYQELFPYIDDDMKQLRIELDKRFLRITNYEILDMRMYYHVGVFALIEEVLKEIVTSVPFFEALGELYQSEISVLYGGYLDQARVIASINRRQANGLLSN